MLTGRYPAVGRSGKDPILYAVGGVDNMSGCSIIG